MFKKLVRLVIAATLIVAPLVMAGCSQQDNSRAGEEEVQKKEELIMALGSEPEDGFDPTTGWGRYGSPLFQSTLLKRDKDLKVVKDLATDYEVSKDGLVWKVTLREDVKFSDGQPLTAKDVVYTFEAAANSGSVVDLGVLDKVAAIGDYQVEFTLKVPQSTFINSLIATGIVPAHAHGSDYAVRPIGSGPFKFVQWDKGQQLIVEANPVYYGPKPFFKKITFLFLAEDAAFTAAKAGTIDVTAIPATFAKQSVPGMKLVDLVSVDNRGIMFPTIEAGGTTAKGYPVGNNVTSDKAIRQAINVAVNRDALVKGVLEGYGTPAYTACDKLPWWNAETVIKDNDMKAAKKILAQAGWQDSNGDGILDKAGIKAEFTLLYPASDQVRQSIAIAVADMIKSLGINIIVEGKSWSDIETMMHSNAVLFGWGSHDPLEMYNLYSSKTAGQGWYNTGFYNNPVVDGYMEKALAASDESEANEYWKKAQWDGTTGISGKGDAPWAWLVNLKHLYLVREGLNIGTHKVQPHGHGWPITDNIVEWTWEN